MSEEIQTHRSILACVDQSRYAQAVADYGAWVAIRMQRPLELLHVIDSHAPVGPKQDHSGAIGLDAQEQLLQTLALQDEAVSRERRTQGRTFLNSLRVRATAAGAAWVDVRQRAGTLEETLSELQPRAELFVLGRRGNAADLTQRDLGRNLEWVVRAVHKPVLAVPDHFTPPSRVVFAFDGSSVTRSGVDMLAGSNLVKGLPIHLVMAGRADAGASKAIEAAAATLSAAGLPATTQITDGDAEEVVAEAIRRLAADLLVMGAYGHSPLRSRLFGSHTTGLLRSSNVAALMLR